jgi:hypothetical protein
MIKCWTIRIGNDNAGIKRKFMFETAVLSLQTGQKSEVKNTRLPPRPLDIVPRA